MADDLSAFISSVMEHWIALMTGGISLLIAAYEKFRGKPVKGFVLTVIAFGCLSVAFFMAWQDEYRALETERQTVTSLTSGFKGRFLAVLTFHEGNGTEVYALISANNLGKPSVLRKWTMTLTGLKLSNLKPIKIPDGKILEQRQHNITITKDIMLIEKDLVVIPEGGEIRGWICFRIEGIFPDQFKEHVSTMKVNFSDVRDTSYSITFDSSIMSTYASPYFPGSGQE
jgi:hypothetical protein